MTDLFGTWLPGQGPPRIGAVSGRVSSTEGGSILVLVDGEPRVPGTAGAGAAERVLALWRQHGANTWPMLRGSWAAVVLDPSRRQAHLAVDRMGTRPLGFSVGADGTIAFGSSALSVAEASAGRAPPRLRAQALYDYMHQHMVPSPATVFAGVAKLAPATTVVLADGRTDTHRYWQPRFGTDLVRNDPDGHAALLTTLEQAVRQHVQPGVATGAFLSGGLDSSTVVGLLARVSTTPARTFSVGFDAEGYDERQFARIAVRHFGAEAAEYVVTPEDVASALPLIATAYDEPFGNSSAIPTFFCAKLAREHGVERLLAGDGGDEIFAGNPHYTRQALFEPYRRLPAWLRAGPLERGLLRAVPEDAPWPLGKLRSYVQQASIPLPERLHSWNFMYREPRAALFTPEFLAAIDPEHDGASMRATWAEPADAAVLDRMLYYDWKYVLADNDLRKVGRMCALAGVEVRYPMLDDELVEFSLGVPARLKIRGQDLRSFYKDAMRGFLPEEIIGKGKHGFGLPFGVWLKTSPVLIDLVASGLRRLAQRGIFQPAFLAGIQARHREGHPGYFGYVIWDLIMLEQWLTARRLDW
jgi:asparagine synthase (glutamine-hydrolysing)